MPIDLQVLCRQIRPTKTVILFGAGSSIPSGGLSAAQLAEKLCLKFRMAYDATLNLADVATLVEMRNPRRDLVSYVRELSANLRPTRGLLNLPLYEWKDIFTTNYDTLIEQAFERARKPLQVLASNFDFQDETREDAISLFKLHGTISKDRSFGDRTSIIITQGDYDLASEYRELLYDRLLHETSRYDVLIIGHSLADPDLTPILNEAISRKRSSGATGKLYALIYTPDPNRAALLEQRGFDICFGGLDDFFAAIGAAGPAEQLVFTDMGDLLSAAPALRPVTVDVNHSLQHDTSNVAQLFHGSPATYADILSGLTFDRDLEGAIETQLSGADRMLAYVTGPAGFGKTSLARQVIVALAKRGFLCWEHRTDHGLSPVDWITVAKQCAATKTNAVLFIDEAHAHLRAIDPIADHLLAQDNRHFRLLLTTSPGKWHSRSKTPSIFKIGQEYVLRRLSHPEVNSLLDLFERKKEIASLVEDAFAGFSRQERLRRLLERCRSDMFVCLKNIFAFDNLDDIILRDYGELDEDLQDVYRTVAAMEASNIRVHRQLVMRVLNIRADFVQHLLGRLSGVIFENTVDDRNGIYAWKGRHQVISEIILKYKYHSQEELFRLYELVIDFINPSYEIERLTINELCDIYSGIGRIHDTIKQNYLYRKLISIAPSQRPPRHRLIHNLIKSAEYDAAAGEIRVFEKELRPDPPIFRYKAKILLDRARNVPGLMPEDRMAILADAGAIVDKALDRFPSDKGLHTIACEIGLQMLITGNVWHAFDEAIGRLIKAEKEYLDPALGRLVSLFKSRADGLTRSA